ncbi:hypothetical protein BDW22DRAFT_1092775 [Trametopsis cervina]|nr:hypothetical protein BDW22DRAFT_1092775 [Trametopsis cervina]
MDGGLAGAGLPSTSTDSPSTPAAALPPSNADGHASEAESSTASAVRGSAAEGTTQDSSSPGASDHPSLSSLPTVPAVPAVGDLDGSSHGPTTDAREDGSASSLSSFHDDGSPREFGRLMIPAHAGGSSSMNPSAAELLAARRPSLPILNLPSSHNGLRRMPSSLSGKGLPKGFDPHERRKSVDTMSANLRRLSTHPYAHLAAANVSVNGHNTGPGHSYGSAPGLLVRRSISHTGPGLSGLEEVQDWLSSGPSSAPSRVPQSANSRTYYLTPTPTHSQIHSPSQNGPNTSQRGPAPPFAGQQQQQSSPPSAHPSTSYSGMSFVNPWQQQSQPSTAVSPSIQAAGFGPSVSPHDMQPPSPGSSAPPLPISQTSYNGSMLAHSVSRRYAADGHGRLQEHQHHSHHHDLGLHMANYAISSRPMPAPLPGPLPDEHFSFGLPASTPASSGSSTSTSPIASDATLSMMSHGGGVMEEEADDASAVSSTYDPQSRFGSLASVASTESSWTSAYWSDAEGRKLSVSAPDGYDGERKGSM